MFKQKVFKCLGILLLGGMCLFSTTSVSAQKTLPKNPRIVFVSPHSPKCKTIYYLNPHDAQRVIKAEKFYNDIKFYKEDFDNVPIEEAKRIMDAHFPTEHFPPKLRFRYGL